MMIKTLRKVAKYLLPAILLVALTVPTTLVLADEDRDKESVHPTTVGQEEQVDRNTKVKVIRRNYNAKGRLESISYEATISGLPTVTDDGKTIDTSWYEKTDNAGYTYYESGNNLFSAVVTPSGRTSLADSNGRLFVWKPVAEVNKQFLDFGEPEILYRDPANENYRSNILQWTAEFTTGLFNQNTVIVHRQLRIIEGLILEYYIIEGNPTSDFTVQRRAEGEVGAEGSLSDAVVFDSSDQPQFLEVNNRKNGFTIPAREFKGKTYPVIVDPTSTFTTSSYDGWLQESDLVWNTARTAASGDSTYSSSSANYLLVFGEKFITTYFVKRTGLFFSTASIPNDATITSAYISLRDLAHDSTGSVIVQSGAPVYPHTPMVMADYSYTHYSGDGGSITLNSIGSGYNNIILNSTGKSWINKTGTTKFMLRHSNDINNTTPAVETGWQFWSCEKGTGYAPKLVVSYTLPVVPPSVDTTEAYNINETSVTLRGYLDDDGGEGCVVKFQYGTTTAYGSTSSSVSGVTSSSYFNIEVSGLSAGTTYHFRAMATNTAGTAYGLDKYEVTLPSEPTGFTATAGDELNALAWTKGAGADKTLIRFATTGYPSSITDGTQAYFDTSNSTNHITLTAGTTYYYSAWSEDTGGYSPSYVTAYATPYVLAAPDATTQDVTAIGANAATLNGYLDALNQVGGTVAVTFQYYKGAGAWADNETGVDTMSAPGNSSANIAGLDATTLYHSRIKAVGDNGTGYGSDVTFTTGANSAPTMTTQAATGTGLTYTTINGKVTADGGVVTTVWFIWGLSADNLNQTTPTVSGLYTDDVFYYNLSVLEPNTQYFFQAVGQNTEGIGYGDVLNFTTSAASAPTGTTNEASSVGANQATLSGTVTYDGGVDCEVQFEWDTNTGAPYANSTGWQAGKVTGDTIEAIISGLTVGQDYFYRVCIKNAHSTVYGSEQTFETVFVAPTNFTAKSVGATTISLTWTRQGDQTYIVYKTTGYPVDRLDGTQVYFGDATSASHDSLSAGMTYFYRAWSWRSGDTWSGTYAEDAATTLPVKTSEEKETPAVQPTPSEIDDMYLEPSIDKLSKIPGYAIINETADTMGMDRGMFWLLAGTFVLFMTGLMIYIPTKSVLLAVIVASLGMILFGTLGIMPIWIVITYFALILGIQKVFGFGSLGGAS